MLRLLPPSTLMATPVIIAALDDAKLMDAAAPAANGFQLNGSAI